MIAWAFPALALCGIFFAYALKVRLSGSNLNSIKFFCCLIFNGFFVVTYIDVIENSDFLFLGHSPDITLEHPFIGWTAFLCILAHSFSLPVKREVKWLFSRR
jgi:hypothetical protein